MTTMVAVVIIVAIMLPRSGQIVVCCIPFPSFTVFGMSASSTTMTPEVY